MGKGDAPNTSILTPAERKRQERVDRETAMIDAAVAEAAELGAGSSSKSGVGSKITATYAQMADRSAYTASSKGSLIPAHRVMDGPYLVEVFFTPADYQALREGYYCTRCWDLQEEPALPEWAVSSTINPCKNVRGRGCGWPKGWQFHELLPFKISKLPTLHGQRK